MKIPKVKRGAGVLVRWEDSCGGDTGWHHEKRKHLKPGDVVTIGRVYHRRKKHLTVILSEDLVNGGVCGVITIPRSAIRSIDKLRYK